MILKFLGIAMPNMMSYIMLLSTFLGIICGFFFPEQMLNIRWIDTLFINLLKLIVTPLIFCAVVSSIISMGSIKRLRSIWIYTLSYIFISVSIAVIIGIGLSNVFKPGDGMSANLIGLQKIPSQLETLNASSTLFKSFFPSNEISIAANFEILPIILFSMVFAIACISVGESAKPLISIFIITRNIFTKIVTWLMYLMPIGLFGLLGSAIAEAYTKKTLILNIRGVSLFIILLIGGLFCQFLWQFAVLKLIVKKNPLILLKNGSKAMLMGFATSSSLAALPITFLIAKEENINQETADFVLPFTTIMNLSGTAMYEAVSALFFCQILGFHLSILSQIGIFFTAMLAGIGAASIPEGGLITMMIVLKSVHVPSSAISLLVPFDRTLDRLRIMTNVWGNLVCLTMVNHYLSKRKDKRAFHSVSLADQANQQTQSIDLIS